MKHDEISRKAIPAIFGRTVSAVPIFEWPVGDWAAPMVGGRLIINTTNRPIYVCQTDGIVIRIDPMTKSYREGLLCQLYHSLGITKAVHGYSTTAVWRDAVESAPIEPIASPRPKNPKHFKHIYEITSVENPVVSYYATHRWARHGHAENLPRFTDTIDCPTTHGDGLQERINFAYLKEAAAIDAGNSLTRALRRSEEGVFVVDFMHTRTLRYGDDYEGGTLDGTIEVPSSIDSTQAEIMSERVEITGESQGVSSMQQILKQCTPTMLWSCHNPKLIVNARQGHYLPEYGLTVGFTSDVLNKALSFTMPDTDVYMGRTGIRIVIPKRVSRTGALYARIGKHTVEIHDSGSSASESNYARAYLYDVRGEEYLAGEASVETLLKDGMSVRDKTGAVWVIPFFTSLHEANTYLDIEDEARVQARMNEVERDLKASEKENQALKQALVKFKKMEEEQEKAKTRTIANVMSAFFTNPVVQKTIIGILLTVGTALIAHFTKGANGPVATA